MNIIFQIHCCYHTLLMFMLLSFQAWYEKLGRWSQINALENQSLPSLELSNRTIEFFLMPQVNGTYLHDKRNRVSSSTFASGHGPDSPFSLKTHSMTIAFIGDFRNTDCEPLGKQYIVNFMFSKIYLYLSTLYNSSMNKDLILYT